MALVCFGLCAVLVAGAAQAGPVEDAIAQLAYTSMDVKVTLVVQRKGNEAQYKKISVQVQDAGAGQNLLMVFLEPSNMKGTGFLALAKHNLDDEYYMYLRTLRRVKRVPNLTENFMLRDFLSLYFLKPRTELWTFKELGKEEVVGAGTLLKVQATPAGEKQEDLAGYARLLHWIDPKKRLIMRTEFFDSSNRLVRKQWVTESLKMGNVWIPTVYQTEDLTEGVSARLEVDDISLNVKFPEDWFTVRHLKTF